MRAGIVLVATFVVLSSATLESVADVLDAVNDCGELGGDCPPDHDCHDCSHCLQRVAIATAAVARLLRPPPRELDALVRPHADRRPPVAPTREILVVPRPTA